jgi:hypothetical protein
MMTMNTGSKTAISLSIAALLGLSLTCNVNAAQTHGKARTDKQIQACVAEIGLHADYDQASRVVHRVESLEQRNLVEMKIGIETTVFLKDDGSEREYRASCVTDTMGNLVKFYWQ